MGSQFTARPACWSWHWANSSVWTEKLHTGERLEMENWWEPLEKSNNTLSKNQYYKHTITKQKHNYSILESLINNSTLEMHTIAKSKNWMKKKK